MHYHQQKRGCMRSSRAKVVALGFGWTIAMLFSVPAFAQPSFLTTYQTTDLSGEWTEIPHEGSFQFDLGGDTWLTVVTEVIDPENLREPFVQSSHFKKLAADAEFRPEPCSAGWDGFQLLTVEIEGG